jgi:hypothetical protein
MNKNQFLVILLVLYILCVMMLALSKDAPEAIMLIIFGVVWTMVGLKRDEDFT